MSSQSIKCRIIFMLLVALGHQSNAILLFRHLSLLYFIRFPVVLVWLFTNGGFCRNFPSVLEHLDNCVNCELFPRISEGSMTFAFCTVTEHNKLLLISEQLVNKSAKQSFCQF